MTQTADAGNLVSGFCNSIGFGAGHLFTAGGNEIDPVNHQLLGTFSGAPASFAIDAAASRVGLPEKGTFSRSYWLDFPWLPTKTYEHL